MVTKKQIQEILKTGFSKTILSKMSESQIKKLHEMVNAIGFVGIDKPIGRMMTKGKSETKEQVTPLPPKQSYKVGDKGGALPPSDKGYAIKKNPDNTVTATPMETEMK